MDERISSTPSISTHIPTTMEAMYSMRAWPKGWPLSAGRLERRKLTNEISELPASERLLTASAVMATL